MRTSAARGQRLACGRSGKPGYSARGRARRRGGMHVIARDLRELPASRLRQRDLRRLGRGRTSVEEHVTELSGTTRGGMSPGWTRPSARRARGRSGRGHRRRANRVRRTANDSPAWSTRCWTREPARADRAGHRRGHGSPPPQLTARPDRRRPTGRPQRCRPNRAGVSSGRTAAATARFRGSRRVRCRPAGRGAPGPTPCGSGSRRWRLRCRG